MLLYLQGGCMNSAVFAGVRSGCYTSLQICSLVILLLLSMLYLPALVVWFILLGGALKSNDIWKNIEYPVRAARCESLCQNVDSTLIGAGSSEPETSLE